MQVFRRAPGEGILIGDEILIEVIESADGKLSLGVVAPRDVRVRGVEPEPSSLSLVDRVGPSDPVGPTQSDGKDSK